MDRLPRRAVLALVATVVLAATLPAAASASITPKLTLTPSTLTAGAIGNVGIDLAFSPSSGDSPSDVTIGFPTGLLVNADLDGGACLVSAAPKAGCELGSGTATTSFLGTSPISLWLVKPPSGTDVAGAALVLGTSPSTAVATAGVTLRTAPDVGLELALNNLPNLGLSALNVTLSSVRAPASCPTTPATVDLSANSAQASTVQTATAPVTVTGCGSLTYSPKLAAAIEENAGAPGATFVALLTQTASESTTKTFAVTLPAGVRPSASVLAGCLIGTPCTVGSASAISPLLPTPALRNGTLILGGSITAPTLTATFPAPYAISLTGAINLTNGSVTFNGVPDVPLTSLALDIGGASAVKAFTTTCTASNLTAELTPWDGGATITVSTPVVLSGCSAKLGAPTLSGASLSGIVKHKAKLAFTVKEGKRAKPAKTIALVLAHGLSISSKKNLSRGITIKGSGGKRLKATYKVGHGVVTITLSSPASKVQVTLASPALSVSSKVAKQVKSELAKKKVSPISFLVRVTNSRKTTTTVPLDLRPKS